MDSSKFLVNFLFLISVILFALVQAESEVTSCPVGRGYSMISKACYDCKPGFFKSDTTLTSCSKCPPGTFSGPIYGADKCHSCPDDKVGYGGIHESISCMSCPIGSIRMGNGTASPEEGCMRCHPGTYGMAGACMPCPMGTASNLWGALGPASCLQCPAGTFGSKNGLSECSICEQGYYSIAGANMCSPCPPGTYAPFAHSQCIKCPMGSYSPGARPFCSPCAPGSFANTTGLSQCDPCPYASESAAAGAISCETCAV
jgi:hypothetical protein